MRVVQMTSVHSVEDTRIFHKQCRSLARDGHEVHLVAAWGNVRTAVQRQGVTIHLVPRAASRLQRMLVTTRQILDTARRLDGDVYQFHDPEFLRLAVPFQQQTGRPVVYDVHEDVRLDLLYKDYIAWPLRRAVAWWAGRQEDKAARQLAAVVSATPRIADRFAGHPRCITLHNFPLMGELDAVDRRPAAATGIVAYVGGLNRQRGIADAIDAIPLVSRPAELHLAGDWITPEFRAHCRARPGWGKVVEHGFLKRDGVRDLLARATVGLFACHNIRTFVDAYPVKLFEYMAAGLPVIATDTPLLKRIVAGAGCGLLVPPEDPSALADAVEQLLADPDRTADMGRRGRQAVIEQYNWEIEFPKLQQLYGELVGQRRAVPRWGKGA